MCDGELLVMNDGVSVKESGVLCLILVFGMSVMCSLYVGNEMTSLSHSGRKGTKEEV